MEFSFLLAQAGGVCTAPNPFEWIAIVALMSGAGILSVVTGTAVFSLCSTVVSMGNKRCIYWNNYGSYFWRCFCNCWRNGSINFAYYKHHEYFRMLANTYKVREKGGQIPPYFLILFYLTQSLY